MRRSLSHTLLTLALLLGFSPSGLAQGMGKGTRLSQAREEARYDRTHGVRSARCHGSAFPAKVWDHGRVSL